MSSCWIENELLAKELRATVDSCILVEVWLVDALRCLLLQSWARTLGPSPSAAHPEQPLPSL